MAQDTQNGEQVYLIDASVYIFRAWFSIPDSMTSPTGEPINAVYGFANFLCDLLEKQTPKYVGVAFDESLTTSFRNKIYPDYKANREAAPEDLKAQFAYCRRLCHALGLVESAHAEYEADDIIGAWAAQARSSGKNAVIVSRDKDLCQLVQPGDRYWDYASDAWLDCAGVRQKFGVDADQIADYLALTGDSVDNIPGIKGVGPKAAVALLNAFGSLAEIYNRISEVEKLEIRGARSLAKKLEDGRQSAELSQRLTAIEESITGLPQISERAKPDADAINQLCDECGFGKTLAGRLKQA